MWRFSAVRITDRTVSGSRWEVEEAMEVYKNNECVVIADEIWSDLILKGSRHIPTQSISPDARNRTIAFYAPSKTFNLAGLVGSYHIVFNRMLRDRLEAKSRKSHYNTMNVLSMHALIGAYEAEGYTWVNELCQVLSENDRVCGQSYPVTITEESMSASRRELTCCSWTVRTGVKRITSHWMNC